MKNIRKHKGIIEVFSNHLRWVYVSLFTLAIGFSSGAYALMIENFSVTDSTVSFDIVGELLGPLPVHGLTELHFVNPTFATPGFVTPASFEAPVSHTWTGTQTLDSVFPLYTGSESAGDFFTVNFATPLAVGEDLTGSVSATFAPGTFAPAEADTLEVYWGVDMGIDDGTLQDIIAVPEVTPFSLLAVGLMVLMAGRRYFRRG